VPDSRQIRASVGCAPDQLRLLAARRTHTRVRLGCAQNAAPSCHHPWVRAIPEKTLEHWSSMYLARRFPDCRLWWPSVDEDITVQSLSNRLGKSLLLEVKTTDWSRLRSEHRLSIDVSQLRRYLRSPIPVYYIFPMPPWSKVLTDGHSWLAGRARSELIDEGQGWFGEWLFVTRAQSLWDWLGPKQRQKSATLFVGASSSWDPSRIWPRLLPWWAWSTFWDGMARCGSETMPALFTIARKPRRPATASGVHTRETMVQQLRSALEGFDLERMDMTVERFVPEQGNRYRRLEELDLAESPLTSGAAGRTTALVHLDLADLRL
jgi:hypothetical protein